MVWGRKNKIKKEEASKINAHLVVIPDIFYGGKDPLIYNEQNKKVLEKTAHKKLDSIGKVDLPNNKKKIIIIASVALVLVVSAASFYYFRQASVNLQRSVVKINPPTPLEKIKEPEKEPVVKEPEVIPATSTEAEVVPPVVIEPQNTIVFPNVLLRDSSDIDIDSLTDQEEEIFGTDSGIWDSDKDGYYDGQEVFNLYNPKGFAPVKIIDSGLVREYINPNWQYRVYYPSVWEAASVDNENNHVIFSSISGDFIEIRSFKKLPSENFTMWFAKSIEGQNFIDLSLFNNRFNTNGYKRKDSLTAYFVIDNAVFVMIYQPSGNATDIPYRHVMQMMYQSFRTTAIFVEIPEQILLPQVGETENLP